LRFAATYAVLLTVFAFAAYVFIRGSTLARIDEFLEETATAVAGALEFRHSQGASDGAAIVEVQREFAFRDIDVFVLDRSSRNMLTSTSIPPARGNSSRSAKVLLGGDFPALLAAAPGDVPALTTVAGSAGNIRLFTLPYTLGSRVLVIATAQSLNAFAKSLHEAELVLLVGLPILVLVATAGGYALARTVLAPVSAMTERAASISASTMHDRLPALPRRDELGRLASVFNDMLDRLERAFEDQRRFMADASHELRTPVAVISGESELALSREQRSPGELRDALATIREESRRLREIVDDLFLLARTQSGGRVARLEDVYVRDIVEECARSGRTLAAAKHIALSLDAAPDDLPLRGDETLLKRLVMNLIDNAVKYTPPSGRIDLVTRRSNGHFIIEVADTGVGIPESDQPHIFDRFYRAATGDDDSGRMEGAGLGLAIARGIARAHGGDVELVQSSKSGSAFRITLPVHAGGHAE
jgi:heavy metal sensor kinase